MNRRLAAAAGFYFLFPIAKAAAQAPVEYEVSFENAAHHEAQITVSFRELGDEPLVLRMSRSSPGRYAIHEFAKNAYGLSAVDRNGEPLAVTRGDPYSWRIDNHGGDVTATYTLYADRADGTYSQVDLTHAHLNMPATFMWAEGLEKRPVTIRFSPPDRSWRVATQLEPLRGQNAFRAPNLQYFLDSPTELSAFDMREWRIGEGAARQTIRLAVHHEGTREDIDIFTEQAKKVVAEQIKIFGEAPVFDYGVYTFLADYLPHAAGDGMEHRNSTYLTSSNSLYESDFSQLGTLSHEFFHAWNVERLRPAELEPFDFTRANPTPSLWFAEGFTTYYGPLTIMRAQESSLEEFLGAMEARMNAVVNKPGRNFDSPQGMSLRAAFVDAATSIDPTNNANTFSSYYSYGAIIALALDLTLRSQFEDLTLDDYMRLLWEQYGRSETPYTHQDLRNALASLTNDAAFAERFFARHIEASALPDFASLLAGAGLKFESVNADKAALGPVSFNEEGDALMVASNTIIGTPLYDAGVDRGDEILRIGRFKIDSERDIERALGRFSPGETATLKFIRRGVGEIETTVAFAPEPDVEITPYEDADMELSAAQKAFRRAWLGASSVNGEKD